MKNVGFVERPFTTVTSLSPHVGTLSPAYGLPPMPSRSGFTPELFAGTVCRPPTHAASRPVASEFLSTRILRFAMSSSVPAPAGWPLAAYFSGTYVSPVAMLIAVSSVKS